MLECLWIFKHTNLNHIVSSSFGKWIHIYLSLSLRSSSSPNCSSLMFFSILSLHLSSILSLSLELYIELHFEKVKYNHTCCSLCREVDSNLEMWKVGHNIVKGF